MKYCFTTLAVGDPYEKLTVEFYRSLKEKTSSNCEFFITTNNKELLPAEDRIHIDIFDNIPLRDSREGFNYNLKCLSLKHVLSFQKKDKTSPFDYIIFTDGDWIVHDGFSENKIENMLNHMESHDLDFLFERPASIGDSRKNPESSFFMDKIYDYEILEYDKWDNAHCVNEQFLVFKNNYKFNFFVKRWEQFLWYTIANDIRNYADGFEIGISALEAGMSWEYSGIFNNFLTECFAFHTKGGDLHIRF